MATPSHQGPASGPAPDPRAYIGVGQYASEGSVTSEAVEVELPVANVLMRIVSFLIDLVILILSAMVIGFLLAQVVFDLSEPILRTLLIVTIVGLFLGIPIATETVTRGKTVGKLVTGLRTVRDDGGPITFRHAVVRGMVGWVEIYLAQGSVALLTSVLSERNRRLGDMAAGTYVINERQTIAMPVPTEMPLPLAAWAQGADISALPDRLALAVRQFLVRAPQLAPQARYEVGVDLARQVAAYVAPSPPPGHHPEIFLAAVLADRRRRDSARLAREAELRARVTRST
ncbi:MAG: RDD family protein [Actinomycetia bacterium]|nr:RDD family protein [Actinomycetes bacterium]